MWHNIQFYELSELLRPIESNEIRFLIANVNDFKIVYDQKQLVLNQGDFLILNANSICRLVDQQGALLISILVDNSAGDLSNNAVATKVQGCSAIERTKHDDAVMTCLMGLIKQRLNPDKYTNVSVLMRYYELLMLIYRFYLSQISDPAPEDLADNQSKSAYAVKKYVDDHYTKPITLDYVAEKFYLSSPYLSRIFKQTFQVSFHKYVTNLRVQTALNDMINTEKTVTDIALDNGFPNVGSFNTAFKAQYGMTPGVYRASYRERQQQERQKKAQHEPKQQMAAILDYSNQRTSQKAVVTFKDIFAPSQQHAILSTSWKKLINLGSAESLLSSSMEQQVQGVQADIKFKYGRIDGIFSDTMLLISPQNPTNYSFTRIDDVLEMLLRTNLIPFVELGKKPLKVNITSKERLKTDNPYSFISQDGFSWGGFLSSFVRHCIAKWGVEEVSRWCFELWYPSQSVLSSQYAPNQLNEQQVRQYLDHFRQTKQCINELLPDVKVGGCGLSLDIDFSSVEMILSQWQKTVLPDFFSVYVYPQDFGLEKSKLKIKNAVSSDPDQIFKMIQATKKVMQEIGVDRIPLYVTQWNMSISDRNFVHDSLFKATYIIRNVLKCANQVAVFGYWQLSDTFGTFGDTNGILHGGSGLLTKTNIKKPAYYAFRMLDSLNGQMLAAKEHVIVTSYGYDRLNVLVSNYKHFNSVYYLNKEDLIEPENINKIFENTSSYVGTVHIEGLVAGRYLLKQWLLSDEHGDVLKQWLNWGKPLDIGTEATEYLRQSVTPQLNLRSITVNDELVLPFELSANAISLFELYRES